MSNGDAEKQAPAEPEPRYMTGREFLAAVDEMRAAAPDGSIFDMDLDDIIDSIEGRP